MRRIAIIGAGQAGLQLALTLRAHGYRVTVVSDRDADRIRSGRVLSTQVMFATALSTERAAGLDFWADEAPRITGMGVTVAGPDGSPAIDWYARLTGYAQSVDQRVKMSGWLEAFAERGGDLVVGAASEADLDALAGSHDLVLVAAGRGELAGGFGRDPDRSAHDRPMRSLAAAYLHGVGPRPGHDPVSVRINLVPGAGEVFVMPALTRSGPCHIVLVEGVPGGPFDVFEQVADPAGQVARMRELLGEYVPRRRRSTSSGCWARHSNCPRWHAGSSTATTTRPTSPAGSTTRTGCAPT
jgi:hypothetical protein